MNFDFLEQQMVEICLSVFDLIEGPRQVAVLPWNNVKNRNRFIAEFFDFHKENEFFTHIFDDFLSFNYLFAIADPDVVRGGKRLFMLTASVPFKILKRKDLLQYYDSLSQLFEDWAQNFQENAHLSGLIVDGQYESECRLQPVLFKLSKYLGELQFILHTMPDTMPFSFISQTDS